MGNGFLSQRKVYAIKVQLEIPNGGTHTGVDL